MSGERVGTLKKTYSLLAIGLAVASLAGCAAFGPTDRQVTAMQNSYAKWVEQARYVPSVEAQGTNMVVSISVSNADHFAINSAIDPLPMLPRDPTLAEEIGQTARTVLPIAAGAWLLKDNIGGKTVNNNAAPTP